MKHLFLLFASILLLATLDISTYGAEAPLPSQKQALNHWRTHYQDQNIDFDAKRQELSSFTWRYEYLLDKGFNVFSIDDCRGQVFSNIRVTIKPNDQILMDEISKALIFTWITSLTIDGYYDKSYKNTSTPARFSILSPWPKNLPRILASENLCLENLTIANYLFSGDLAFNDDLSKTPEMQWDDLSSTISRMPLLKSFELSNCRLPKNNFIDGIIKILENQSLEELCLNNLNLQPDALLKLVPALEKSSITRLYLPAILITPEVCEAIVNLLNNGKTFDILCLKECLWQGLAPISYYYPLSSYYIVKKLGMAATGKVKQMEHLGLEPYARENKSPDMASFDYTTYDPMDAFLSDIAHYGAELVPGVLLFTGMLFVVNHVRNG